jgi:hypothetical protein
LQSSHASVTAIRTSPRAMSPWGRRYRKTFRALGAPERGKNSAPSRDGCAACGGRIESRGGGPQTQSPPRTRKGAASWRHPHKSPIDLCLISLDRSLSSACLHQDANRKRSFGRARRRSDRRKIHSLYLIFNRGHPYFRLEASLKVMRLLPEMRIAPNHSSICTRIAKGKRRPCR